LLDAKRHAKQQWMTPVPILERVRRCFGGTIDVDPASNPEAQRRVRAKRYYDIEDDGLTREWWERVFLNPPYQSRLIDRFVLKGIAEYQAGRASALIIFVHSSTSARWFNAAKDACTAWCEPFKRINCDRAEGPATADRWPSIFFYFGNDVTGFEREFGDLGRIYPNPNQAHR
jgi:DNA N-6-adenine-methyltransferase (Dam)